MRDFWKKIKFKIGDARYTPFCAANGVYQDGTTPVYRDKDGKLWAISGHSHMGNIVVFCGTSMRDLKKLYYINTEFSVGKAGEAFNCIRYPDGILPRGSIWPFGLYICPVTHRFFVFFHNETGWAGHGTAYDATGPCETPFLDSDFRHIGLMHSDDEGRTWKFDRWILAGEQPGFTEKYNPGAGVAKGQKYGVVNLGTGDFSCYIDDEYIYIFYNIIKVNLETRQTEDIDVYVARSVRREDGIVGDFVKYYNGAFSEAGVFGRESVIVKGAWHAKVVKLKDLGLYMMSYSGFNKNGTYDPNNGGAVIRRAIELRFSCNLVDWSESAVIKKDDKDFGNHYCAFYPDNTVDNFDISGNKFIIQLNGNGTDVMAYDAELIL